MFENEILKCEDALEKIEKFGYVLVKDYDIFDIYEKSWNIIKEAMDNNAEIDKQTIRAYNLSKKINETKCVTFYELSCEITEIQSCNAKWGATSLSGMDLIPFVEKINAIYCIENPNKYPNKVAFGWNNAFNKSNPRAYLFGCIKNYLHQNSVEFDEEEIKYLTGIKQDPMYIDWVENRI